ncbi:MFS transporter [Maribacter sp. HTCC2170]|uniref:MFS transporter n=1 Tax=Maribacter sp. (strain HTCC2170 / KCCM 42371) TaxID=313603 RepID=UPI00006BD416|nr:MFS transporter [Maribacter sp. HTCC2170]EAR02946.1 putative sugar transport-related, membrane protein [Maribacter sp. HTCC2170]
MTSKKIEVSKLFPVFLTFIVMGFVDIVGVSTGYVQKDFGLSDSMAQFIPSMVFIWFFVFSIPVGILQDKLGKKKMMNIGIIITILGMLIPFLHYSFEVILIAFVFMGIGNTIVQVAASPLLQEVSSKNKLSSFLSLSQFIKAITSLTGPIIATYLAITYDNWILVFLIYAIISLVNLLWLSLTKIDENIKSEAPATFGSCMALLTNKFVLTMVIAIFLIVGADVGMNTNIQAFLMKIHGLTLENASYGISVYFTALMISRFTGAILLQYLKPMFFLVTTTVLSIIGTTAIMFSATEVMAYISIFIVGLGAGNLFPLVFSMAINKMPTRSNEISGLLIMAIVGGAIIPPIMGFVSSYSGILGSLTVLGLCFVYLLIIPFSMKKENT